MRIWLDPDRMSKLGVTVKDVDNAVTAQNAQHAVGRVGTLPRCPNNSSSTKLPLQDSSSHRISLPASLSKATAPMDWFVCAISLLRKLANAVMNSVLI